MSRFSVVIPTYNRGTGLVRTVGAVLKSRVELFTSIEVLVVDDGSAIPAERVLAGLDVPAGVTLSVVRHSNAGPAFSRNVGFRRTAGQVVLFMDDDVVPPPNLLQLHAEAHMERPGSVIYGRCEWLPPPRPGAVFRALKHVADDRPKSQSWLTPVGIVASGQLSVERGTFSEEQGVYRDDLVTPAAEEFELSSRLLRRGTPILLADGIVAQHDSPTGIADLCRQQYKHGMGCGEAARRCPETLQLEQLARIITASTVGPSDSLSERRRKRLKGVAASGVARGSVLRCAKVLERVAPQADALGVIYRMAIALHFHAGVREGLSRFAQRQQC
jgi:glycosyltransferase involved in cell wall biosynthesis